MKHCLIVVFLACFNSLFSQQFTTSVSEKFDYQGPLELVSTGKEHIGMDLDMNKQLFYTFTLNKIKHRIILLKYDMEMKLVKKVKLSDGDKVYGPFPPLLKKINSAAHVFYFQLSDDKENIDIFDIIVSPDQLDISSPKKVLSLEQKNLGVFKLERAFDVLGGYRFIIEQSPDRSKTLVLWCSGRNNKVFYSVLDSAMNILRTKAETIADSDKFILQNVCIDNKGNVYAGYNTENILVSPANAETHTLTVQLLNGQAEQVFVSAAHDKDMIYIAGIYGQGKEKQTGAFSRHLNINNFNLSASTQTAFPAELKEKIYQQLKNHHPKEKTTFSEIVFAPLITGNGQLNLLGKAKKTIHFQVTNGISQKMDFGSFIYAHIGTNPAKFVIIPKGVHNDYYFSCPFKDKMLFFWQDFDENLTRDITEVGVIKNPNMVTFVAIISEDGAIKRQIASSKSGLVGFAQQLTSSSLLVPAPTATTYSSLRTNIEIYKKSDFYWNTIQIKDAPAN